MKTKKFDIPLKGDRAYIQGPDLFNLAHQTVSAEIGSMPETFEISFHRMAYNQVELVWDTNKGQQDAFAAGSWAKLGGDRGRFWIRELESPLSKRQPYPEEKLFDHLEFNGNFTETKLNKHFPYSAMEIWVSMIKAMHQRHYTKAEGKWVFARAKIGKYDPNQIPALLRVELSATLGTKLTRNSVFLNDKKIGDVFFGLM